MPEPTDHRAEAEESLAHAKADEDETAAIACALIGIGHALLALGDRRGTEPLGRSLPPSLLDR